MPFARELAGPPLCPVFCWWVLLQFRTTTPASYVGRGTQMLSDACLLESSEV
jgi:hypothetical protein